MATSPVIRFVAIVLVAVTLAGCNNDDTGGGLPPGWRVWVVTVRNASARLAVVGVAEDAGVPGRVVGTANPNSVPPGATVDVAFGIPPGFEWAIFVNPGPNTGPLVLARDVPGDASGRMPFTIMIASDGNSSTQVPGPALPGWFGN
jgi:hypothetical protein